MTEPNQTQENAEQLNSVDAADSITLVGAIRKSALGLAIFAFFTAGIITLTQFATRAQIVENERAFEARLLLSILPEGADAAQVVKTQTSLGELPLQNTGLLNVSNDDHLYQAQDSSGAVSAVILPLTAPEGYTEAIRLIVGISREGEIISARVTRHKETPGLGDQIEIEKSDWILSFDGTSLINPTAEQWAVQKDGGVFDQMTGATITPRAIVKSLKQALEFFEANKDVLLQPIELKEIPA